MKPEGYIQFRMLLSRNEDGQKVLVGELLLEPRMLEIIEAAKDQHDLIDRCEMMLAAAIECRRSPEAIVTTPTRTQ